MSKSVVDKYTERLNLLNEKFSKYSKEHGSLSGTPKIQSVYLKTRIKTTVADIAGIKSDYYKMFAEIEAQIFSSESNKITLMMGVVNALLYGVKKGYLSSITELVHANVFSDFLEMADHLSDEGYKAPAAVVAGSTLETHIKKLAEKHEIDLEFKDKKGKLIQKSIDTLSSALVKLEVFTKNEKKQITAWYGIRNSSAHGKNDFSIKEVKLMIEWIRHFISRFPA
ncbi:MAG: hypothetical protein HeimC2_21660 [Candidatus Heimdallarchaeota archaeon LC_2]|nr:MAG: hypothetical protein HeimC2_21660 [Candidatus Heimdallarchaeota archaeon LC_2]